MNFEMDQQSYNDLSIFGKAANGFSIFELYSITRTVGGRDKMLAMMKSPVNSRTVLYERRDSIEFFSKSTFALKLNNESFDLILHYLKHGGVLLRDNFIDSLAVHVNNKINPNQEYYNVKVGLKRLLPLLQHGKEISESLIEAEVDYLKGLGNAIKAIVEKPDFTYAISLSKLKDLGFHQLAKVDSIIRKSNLKEINELLTVFYELDVFETLARVLTENKFCLPSFIDDGQAVKIEIEELFHPALAKPVPASINIDEKNNLMFLSGSNMSGKSSFLKSIGLSIYLAHLGFPVPAKKITTTIFNGLITTINLPDSVQNGLSHYYTEVVRVKKIATLLGEKNKMIILLDELFKGTNSKDAYDASLLVLNGFAEIKNSIFIISSHITALATKLTQENISLQYLEHHMADEKPVFTYKLKKGVANDGIGMYFIQSEKIKELLDKAKLNNKL